MSEASVTKAKGAVGDMYFVLVIETRLFLQLAKASSVSGVHLIFRLSFFFESVRRELSGACRCAIRGRHPWK